MKDTKAISSISYYSDSMFIIGKVVLLSYTDGPSAVTLSSEDIVEKEGGAIDVTCSADCNPSCTFQWIFTDESGSTNTVGSGDTLNIPNLVRANHGTYTCKATNKPNDDKEAEKSIQVTVTCEYFKYDFETFSQMQSDLISTDDDAFGV